MKVFCVAAYLMSTSALAYDRCYTEAAPKGQTSCFIAVQSSTYICEGQGKLRTANCIGSVGEAVACELRPTKLTEPPDIWCEQPSTPAPTENATATLMAAQPPKARRAPDAHSPQNSVLEKCAPLLAKSKSAFDLLNYDGCLKREAVLRGIHIPVPKKTDCTISPLGNKMTCLEY